jgi:hypothetical protein
MDWRDVVLSMRDRVLGFDYDDRVVRLPGLTIRYDPESKVGPPKEGELHIFSSPPPNAEFAEAVACYSDGSDACLLDYLHSDRPFGEGERALLAELLRLPPKDARSRHKQRVRFAAYLGRRVYQEICDECKRLDVSYRGHADDIRRHCAKFVAAIMEGVAAKEILDVMSRAGSRRSLGDESTEVVLGPMTFRLNPKFPAKSDS